jgi:hypothetical protein
MRLRFTRLRRAHRLPTRGFSDQILENPKMRQLQAVDSIPIFQLTFGFVWNCLEIFDLDGHNLGTVIFDSSVSEKQVLIFPNALLEV